MPTNDPSKLLVHSALPERTGTVIETDPELAGWEYISLRVQRIDDGDVWSYATGEDEVCLVPLSGSATVEADGEEWAIHRPGTVFDGKPTALYLPRESTITVTATSDVEIAIAGSRADERFPPKLIEPDDIDVEIRGAGNAARQISHIIKPEFPAQRLLVVEVFTPSGNWSSYPPHKHDVSNMPTESDLEEIYYYRIQPGNGFGLQRLYSDAADFDYAWVIKDGDMLLVHEGYHAFAVAHGYTGYYLNVLAGNEAVRTMQPADDPEHAWTRATWTDEHTEGLRTWQEIDERVNAGAGRRRA